MSIGDELLKDGNAWHSLNTTMQQATAASLLESMETIGFLTASTMPIGTFNTTLRSNIGELTAFLYMQLAVQCSVVRFAVVANPNWMLVHRTLKKKDASAILKTILLFFPSDKI
jgi:hypothetical protein